MFKYLKTFGIVFVIVTKCVAELTKFFALWAIEILLFTSVAFLLLGQLDLMSSSFQDPLIFFIGGIYGSWYTNNSYTGGFYSPIS